MGRGEGGGEGGKQEESGRLGERIGEHFFLFQAKIPILLTLAERKVCSTKTIGFGQLWRSISWGRED